MRFKDKTAIVTGAASGIGLAIVRRLVDEGAVVAAADMNADALAKQNFPEQVKTFEVDLRNESEVEALVAGAMTQFGKLDACFNAAGVSRSDYILDMEESDWDLTNDVCLKSVMFCMKHQGRQFVRQKKGGAIVNIASICTDMPIFGGSSYTSSKAGLEMLTKNGALEFAQFNVRVNAVSPGLVRTAMTERFFLQPEIVDGFLARIPLGLVASPDDIAAPAIFLATDDAKYVSGTSLLVDGAWSTSGYPDMRPFRPASSFVQGLA